MKTFLKNDNDLDLIEEDINNNILSKSLFDDDVTSDDDVSNNQYDPNVISSKNAG